VIRTTIVRRVTLGASTALLLAAAVAGPAAAHSQTVLPPPKDAPVVSGPISKAWGQAHCNAAAPAIVADSSNGVVSFRPAAALPCPLVENPGGQVHGD
jgi:hypothetical protein